MAVIEMDVDFGDVLACSCIFAHTAVDPRYDTRI